MNWFKCTIVIAVLTVSSGAMAQGGGGFGNFSPQQMQVMQAKMKAWQKWRDNHKYINALSQTLMGFAEIEKDPATKITKDQAKKIYPVIVQYRSKPKLTDDEAKLINKKITEPLTVQQIQKIATAPKPGQGGRGFGGGGRPSGGGSSGGGQSAFDPTKIPDPQDYNPLNLETMPFKEAMGTAFADIKRKSDAFYQSLAERAK